MSDAKKAAPPAPRKAPKPTGIWRDRGLLVVSKGTVQYPKRCVKTNTSEDVSLHTIDVSKMGNARLVTGVTVAATAAAVVSQGAGGPGGGSFDAARNVAGASTQMPIPFSDKWMKQHKFRRLMSQLVAYGGIAALFLGVIGYVVALGSFRGESLVSTAILCLIGLLCIVVFAGLFSLLVVNQPPLRLRKQTDKHVWIKGVCREFLEPLPEFSKVENK